MRWWWWWWWCRWWWWWWHRHTTTVLCGAALHGPMRSASRHERPSSPASTAVSHATFTSSSPTSKRSSLKFGRIYTYVTVNLLRCLIRCRTCIMIGATGVDGIQQPNRLSSSPFPASPPLPWKGWGWIRPCCRRGICLAILQRSSYRCTRRLVTTSQQDPNADNGRVTVKAVKGRSHVYQLNTDGILGLISRLNRSWKRWYSLIVFWYLTLTFDSFNGDTTLSAFGSSCDVVTSLRLACLCVCSVTYLNKRA